MVTVRKSIHSFLFEYGALLGGPLGHVLKGCYYSNIVDDLRFTAIGGKWPLDVGLTVLADGGTVSAISERGKQPGDLTEQGLSDDQSSFQCK